MLDKLAELNAKQFGDYGDPEIKAGLPSTKWLPDADFRAGSDEY